MAGITPDSQRIINARSLVEMAVQFNIGADILAKGNRFIESKLGAENMTGDTVMVPIVDGGKVFDHLDLSNEDLSVQRDAVPVSVGPLSTGAALSVEDLTLAIKQPEVMGKRVANMALEASNRAVKSLTANALNATKILNTDITSNAGFAGRQAVYDLFALCEASKLAGETFGVLHPMVWSKLIAMFQNNYSPNDKVGNDLYKNELGDLAGIRWTRTQLLKLITGKTISENCSFDFQATFAGYDVQAPGAVPNVIPGPTFALDTPANVANFFEAGAQVGDLSLPFTLAEATSGNPVNSTDMFGNDTGHAAIFHFVADAVSGGSVTAAHLAAPVFFEGARTNVYCKDYVPYDAATPSTTGTLDLVATNYLDNGVTFLPPACVWKRDDFLVAVKGLEKFYGCDSMTIPTVYRDKNILPLRGWAWTDALKAKTLFRVDVLLGMAAYTRTSMNALYLQA